MCFLASLRLIFTSILPRHWNWFTLQQISPNVNFSDLELELILNLGTNGRAVSYLNLILILPIREYEQVLGKGIGTRRCRVDLKWRGDLGHQRSQL
jgi:hypothetical protein